MPNLTVPRRPTTLSAHEPVPTGGLRQSRAVLAAKRWPRGRDGIRRARRRCRGGWPSEASSWCGSRLRDEKRRLLCDAAVVLELVDSRERGHLVALGQRRVVEHVVEEVVDGPTQRDDRLPDVHQL